MKNGKLYKEKIRAFVALELPEEVKALIGSIQTQLQGLIGKEGLAYTKPESSHITLKFIGDMQASLAPMVLEAIKKALTGLRSFTVETGSIGAFPSPAKPKVAWLGFKDVSGLKNLAERIDAELTALGFEKEARAFHPHLTLVRIKEPGAGKKAAAAIQTLGAQTSVAFTVTKAVLYKSVLHSAGAVHTPLGLIELR